MTTRTRETAQFVAQREMVLRDAFDPSLEYTWTSMRPRVRACVVLLWFIVSIYSGAWFCGFA